jgi:predicted O-methyltransferase YrrM
MNPVTRLKAALDRNRKLARTLSAIQTLRRGGDADLGKLADTLERAARDADWSREELACFERVAAIRQAYVTSDRMVTVRDFGAGDPGDRRTAPQMEQGVLVRRGIAEVCQAAATPPRRGQVLFAMVRAFEPAHCLELGTSLGISAAYQVLALKLNGRGRLTTIEGAEELARTADEALRGLGWNGVEVVAGRFADVLPDLLCLSAPIELVFIDGHHDQAATKQYFELIHPFLARHALVVLDDIGWSDGMRAAWQEIRSDARVKYAVDLGQWGLCLLEKGVAGPKASYAITL